MATFPFELVSPDKVLYSGPAQSVVVPGYEGDFQVLSDHAPTMAAVRPGVVGIEDAAGKHHRVFVRGGFADVNPLGLTILAETAIPFEDLSEGKLEQEIRNAEEDVADAPDELKQVEQEKLDRLRELKDAMKLGNGTGT
jgi:F-type H+-transporting ATPase subunit epsilon